MSKPSGSQPKPGLGRWRTALVCLAAAILVGVWLSSGVQRAREAARHSLCANYFQQTALAMRSYAQANGCLPPAYLADGDARPAHSWRVLLLPFLEQEGCYRQYRFDEPWNSPKNLQLADRPLDEHGSKMYVCPSDLGAGMYDTSQVVFTGRHTAFDGPRPATFEDFADGSSNTALGSEISESGIHWMEPRDLELEKMRLTINDRKRIGLRSNHVHGVNMVFADGSVRTINDDIDPSVLRALITIDQGENVGRFLHP